MGARLFRIVVFLALILSAKGVTAATVHYISKSLGSDTNAGTSKSAPWAHLPGMPSCTGNCASYTPAPGDSFILYGGDTWVASDLGVTWTWGGTSSGCVQPYGTGATSTCIYIGVDQTWYNSTVCGASFCRPVWDCQSSECTSGHNNQLNIYMRTAGEGYITIDNIEMKGYQESSPTTVVNLFGNNIEVENCYFHGWSHTSAYTSEASLITYNSSSGNARITGGLFHNNVVDGQDTSQDMFRGLYNGDQVYDNVFRYTVAEIDGQFNSVYGNLVEYEVTAYTGLHCDLVFIYSPLSGNNWYAYNNVVRNPVCGGSGLWVAGQSSSTEVAYIFNNVVYNISNAWGALSTGNHASYGNTGTYYVYNNTIDTGGGAGGYCTGNGESGSISTVYYSNNHCIATTGVCDAVGATCTNNGTNLSQTEAQANAQGYTANQTYAYSPINSSGSTVGAGTDYTSFCATAGTALCSDVSYASYDATNHTVVMRTVTPRPSTGAWDIGAYQFASSQTDAPQPPLDVQATVQ